LSETIRQCRGNQLDLIVLFSRHDQTLEGVVTKENFALSCTPAINLFPRRADRIHLSEATEEYQVIPDRTRPLDFEVYSITRVAGLGSSSDEEQQFFPFYAQNDLTRIDEHKTFYTTNRVPRLLSSRQQQQGPRSGYIGSEVFLTLVDGLEGPCRQSFRQLSVETLCTNRDLALQMPIGRANTDFSLQISAPVQSVRILCGPTRPRTSPIHNSGELSWRLINQLSLNYLSLIDNNQKQGAAALRELLAVYIAAVDPAALRQIEAVHSVASRPIVRRIPAAGPIMYGRGVEISLTLDEGGFEGSGAFLLGSVLEEFFARYVSINSFTETVLHSLTRGEIARWPLRTGRRHSL
jgi:type VI secretion system protein ImpG